MLKHSMHIATSGQLTSASRVSFWHCQISMHVVWAVTTPMFFFKIKALQSHNICLIFDIGKHIANESNTGPSLQTTGSTSLILFLKNVWLYAQGPLSLLIVLLYTTIDSSLLLTGWSESQVINNCFSLESQYYQLLFHVRPIHAEFWHLEIEFCCEFNKY